MGNPSVKSLLNLYLEKVSRGDEAYLERLADQLAERLVYVPLLTKAGKGEGSSIKVEAICVSEDGSSLIPVFTQERMLQDWCREKSTNGQSITIICADFCGALSSDSWLWVNPGAQNSVKLNPTVIDRMRTVSISAGKENQAPAPNPEPVSDEFFREEALEPLQAADSSTEQKKKRSLLGLLGLKK